MPWWVRRRSDRASRSTAVSNNPRNKSTDRGFSTLSGGGGLPTFAADEPFSPVRAIAAAAAVAGLFMLRFDSEFGKVAAVTTDPRVAEALSYHN